MNSNSSSLQSNVCDHLPFPVNMVSYISSRETHITTVFTCSFTAVSWPFTFIGNILVFMSVLRKFELRTVHNTSILFLAATDLLVASVAQPAFVVYQASKLREDAFSCVALAVYTSTVFICTGLSIVTLIFITLERYFAIFHPFKYQHFVTTVRTVVSILGIWFIWIVFIGFVRFSPRGATTSTLSAIASALIFTCLLITLFVYCKVQNLVRRTRRTVSVSGSTESSGENTARRRVPETKTSRTAAILTGSLVVCLLPTLIISSVFQARATDSSTLYHVIYPLTDTAVLLNSTLNPFIYVFRSQTIRRSIKDMFKL